MWITRQRWTDLQERCTVAERNAQYCEGLAMERLHSRNKLEEIRAFLENENRTLRERLIEAEAAARTGQAQAAIWAIRTNQLQAERDQLFARLVPGIQILTPHVSPSGMGAVLEPPAVSFDHDPHGQAPAPDPITVPADDLYPEASGVAYDPFRDVRDLAPDA
jgi:hypothetical protein